MKLNELFVSDFGETPQMGLDDQIAKLHLDDTRKPKITLMKLNKLRKLRELKRFQELKKDSLVSIMYGNAGEAPAF